MPSYHNIERSPFRRGQYTGWDSQGRKYLISRHELGGPWWCEPTSRDGLPTFYASTLALISSRLAAGRSISALRRVASDN